MRGTVSLGTMTKHFAARAAQRGLPDDVRDFVVTFGVEVRACGATSVTVLERWLPADARDSELARRARDWVLVLGNDGRLMTCYRRRDASKFLRKKMSRPSHITRRAA